MKHVQLSMISCGFLLVVASAAFAQAAAATPPPAAATAAATPAAQPAAAEQTAAQPAAASSEPLVSLLTPPAGSACFPGCRKGFVCRAGECVSQCNPPCGADEMCTEQAECVMREPATPPADPTAEKHDGFYLHLAAGIGGGTAERETGAGNVKYEGGVSMFSVDVGGTPVENLVVFGRMTHFTLSDPTIKIDGDKVASSSNDGLSFGMLGAGVAYYFMPINLFVGGALGLATASTQIKGDDSSKAGFGVNLDVGKEWWVSDQWGIGAALRISAANVPPGDNWGAPNKHLRAGALGVLFSATYQ